jgi:hypothetical protein
MTDATATFPHEGQPAFRPDTEDQTPADSQSDNNETDEAPDAGGAKDNNQQNGDGKPFDEHPRWKQREDEWKNRFNDQEKRHTDEIDKLRQEFTGKREENANQVKIPGWFGGDQTQWDEYRAHEDTRLKEAEERAYQRLQNEKSSEDKRVKEANDYMQSEMSAIESDKELNPTGAKIDPNKLLKFVLDNDIVDSKGRWNYRAAYKMMQGKSSDDIKKNNKDRKAMAGATTSDNKAEDKQSAFKTSADFKKNRPW